MPTKSFVFLLFAVLLLQRVLGQGDSWIFEGEKDEEYFFAVVGSGITTGYTAGEKGFVYLQQVEKLDGKKNVTGCLRNARFESSVSVSFEPARGTVPFTTTVLTGSVESKSLSI